jgi:hypothetical protein
VWNWERRGIADQQLREKSRPVPGLDEEEEEEVRTEEEEREASELFIAGAGGAATHARRGRGQ